MTLSPEMDLGRRTAATGVLAPASGACPAGMHPPFSFRSWPKRKRAVHGPKEKGAKRAPVQWPSARDEGRRIGASADFAWPSGTLSSSARSILPSRGGWCRSHRVARTHLTSFSFRAFRFATRSPGGRGGLYHTRPKALRIPVGADALIGPLRRPSSTIGSAAAKIGARCIPVLPRAGDFPKGRAFPSLTSTRECQPSPAGGRRSAPAQTDPPNIFSTGRGEFSF